MSVSPHTIQIKLDSVGKKFGREWIFKNLSTTIEPGEKMVILGSNGSGKSTLLQTISGYVLPNSGSVAYLNGNDKIETEELKNHISLASPYLELIEDYSLPELISHCAIYKPFLKGLGTKEIIEISGLQDAKNKIIRNYSSGMKQRVRLTLAILAESKILFLDEPVSNLDRKAIEWFNNLINEFALDKTIIVCSNSIKEEYLFCKRELDIAQFK